MTRATGPRATGLRERKKRRTREALEQAAAALVVERGYADTTLADIADAAEVSARTIFSYFGSKEDILFAGWRRTCDAFSGALADRPPGHDTIATWRDFVFSWLAGRSELERRLDEVIGADEALGGRYRARLVTMQEVLAAAIARDLGSAPGDVRPTLAAASLAAGFGVLEDLERRQGRLTPEEIAGVIDPVIAFARAGLEAVGPGAPAPDEGLV
jgi:AcrR family transcriptional regulator